jgi:hypothetical protein
MIHQEKLSWACCGLVAWYRHPDAFSPLFPSWAPSFSYLQRPDSFSFNQFSELLATQYTSSKMPVPQMLLMNLAASLLAHFPYRLIRDKTFPSLLVLALHRTCIQVWRNLSTLEYSVGRFSLLQGACKMEIRAD